MMFVSLFLSLLIVWSCNFYVKLQLLPGIREDCVWLVNLQIAVQISFARNGVCC